MPETHLPRRQFIHTLGLGSLAGLLPSSIGFAQEVPAKAGAVTALNRFPGMMQEWLMLQMHHAAPTVSEWKSKEEAETYVKQTKERIRQCFGTMPEKTPLNARITGTLERDGYRIENIVFESRPGFMVAGNLYVPTKGKGPFPGVVGLCGHSNISKAATPYQSFIQGLARQGYVSFLIDPIGQGERFQWSDGWGKTKKGGGVGEHIQLGNPMCLIDEFIGSWMAWDGIRALDYLLTRPEVDPKHLGVTGNSGGGTQTTWLMALEDRWTMAAPACFVTTFRRNAENELPADTEQCPPAVLAHHLEHSDFVAAMAPKPVIIVAQEKDFFDVRGSIAAYERLKKLYTALGKPENIQLQIGPDPHGYTQPNREAMYRFFNRITGNTGDGAEPTLTKEDDEALWCAPKGGVANLGSKPMASFTKEKAERLAKERRPLIAEELVAKAKDLLRLPERTGAPDYRILRSAGKRSYPTKAYSTYAVATEDEIEVIVTRLTNEAGFISRPTADIKRAVLYVSHRSVDQELRDEPLVKELISGDPDAAFYACDVRGIGDSQPNTCGVNQFESAYGSHYFYAAHGLMLDKPLLGQRSHDVLRVVDLLASVGHQEIHLVGKGWGALPAAFAALVDERIGQVTLKHALTSYAEVAMDADYDWPYAALLPSVLQHFDLPQVYEALEKRGLKNLEPWGARDGMKP